MFWKWRNRDRRNQKYCLRLKKKEDVRIHVWNHTSDEKEYSIKEEQSRLISARSSLSSRCTVSRVWKGREIQREGEAFWTTVKSDEEFIWNDIGSTLVARQRTYSRGELHCLRKKGEPCYPFLPSSSLLLPPLRISFLSSPFFLFFFALHSRKRAVSCHLRSSSSECHERINAINRLEEGFFFFYRETGKFLWNFYLLLSFYLLLFLRMFVVGVGLDSNLKIERMIRSVFQFSTRCC